MARSVEFFKTDLAKVRTGRAHAGMIDHVKVSCYGQEMPLVQLATITVGGPRQLLIAPWDKSNEAVIEKAIREADLGLNPAADSGRIRIDLPELSQERRAELVKVVKKEAEAARVAVRNIRRDELHSLKSQVKEGEMSEDERKRCEDDLQKHTDKAVAQIDQLAAAKSEELMGK